jgi:UMF1 family MFS transporter
MVFIGNTDWALGALLFTAAYVNYSCAKIIYNSLLVRLAEPDQRDRVSSIGWAVGYLSSGLLLALNFGASFVISDSARLARLSLCSAGLWWALFSLFALRILRRMPSSMPPSPSEQKSVLFAGFTELGNTLREIGRFPHTLLFLAAYLIYTDGISTVTTLSADYGQKELGLDDSTLLGAILLVQFTGFGGTLLLGRFAERWGAKRVISASLLVWIAVVVTVYFMQAHSPIQFYAVALVLSIVLGGTQALSRSLYSGMIPHGKGAEYYSLYEISSSGTSALGPLLFGLTLQNTGSYRTAIVSLLVFFIIGLTLFQRVNPAHAITAAGNQPPTSLT